MFIPARRAFAFVTLLASVLAAQALAQDGGIRNWTAPPYWLPAGAPPAGPETQATEEAHGRAALGRQSLAPGPSALPFIALFPCRLVDTRAPAFPAPLGGGFLPAATVRSYTLTGVCNLPANAKAVSLNATVVNPTGPGFLTLYPEGGAFPPVSTLNFLGHDVIVNAAVVPLSATGGISVVLGVSGGDVILDTNGYYTDVPSVTSLNTLTGDLSLVAGTNVTITPGTGSLTIASTGGSGGPPTGPAGGSLSGTYPNPGIAANAVGSSQIAASAVTDAKIASVSFAKVTGLPGFVLKAGDTMTGLLTLNSNIDLTNGAILKNGLPFFHANATLTFPNVFAGINAGASATSGQLNAGFGTQALTNLTTGNFNIALGNQAGQLVTTGSNNIDIGNAGAAAESGTIRVGTPGSHLRAFLSGVRGVSTGVSDALPVVIDSNGQLGTVASLPPGGPAGGSLAGTYPNPTLAAGSVGTTQLADASVTDQKIAVTGISYYHLTSVPGFVLNAGDTMTGTLVVSPGNINLATDPSTATSGSIMKGTQPFLHNFGSNNTFVGVNAGNFSMTGTKNTASGYKALYSNTTGDLNMASGYSALSLNTTGSANTASGHTALQKNTEGSWNTATGVSALPNNTTGSSNTASGADALFQNTTGSENTASGVEALFSNTTGSYNTAIGNVAGARTGSGTGYGGGGITYVANTAGNYNTFVGHGTGATASVSNCTAVGIDAYCDGNDQVRLGNSFVGSIGGKVGWSALSDARAKEDVRDLERGLDLVLSLRPVSYRLKGGNGRTDLGFLAQDVEALLGEAYGVLSVGGDADRTLSLRYQDFIAPLVKAVQEQQAEIEKDRGEIRDLRARLERLEALLAGRSH